MLEVVFPAVATWSDNLEPRRECGLSEGGETLATVSIGLRRGSPLGTYGGQADTDGQSRHMRLQPHHSFCGLGEGLSAPGSREK